MSGAPPPRAMAARPLPHPTNRVVLRPTPVRPAAHNTGEGSGCATPPSTPLLPAHGSHQTVTQPPPLPVRPAPPPRPVPSRPLLTVKSKSQPLPQIPQITETPNCAPSPGELRPSRSLSPTSPRKFQTWAPSRTPSPSPSQSPSPSPPPASPDGCSSPDEQQLRLSHAPAPPPRPHRIPALPLKPTQPPHPALCPASVSCEDLATVTKEIELAPLSSCSSRQPSGEQSTTPREEAAQPRTATWESATARKTNTDFQQMRRVLFMHHRQGNSGDETARMLVYKQNLQNEIQQQEQEARRIIENREWENLQVLLEDAVAGRKRFHNEINPTELEDLQLHAKGAAAKVYRAKYKSMAVAVKHYSDDNLNFSETEFRKEIALMSILKHPNLLHCVGASTMSKDTLYIVTPFCPYTLDTFVKEIEINNFIMFTMAMEIAAGMNYLHSLNLIHRDLKSSNILVTDDTSIKIVDFGTVRVVNRALMTGNLGTVQYMAPELFNNHKYSEKADVYSYGMVLWEMLTQKVPYYDREVWAIPVSVVRGDRPIVPRNCHPTFRKILKHCWRSNPSRRPCFSEVLQWLQSMAVSASAKTLSRDPNQAATLKPSTAAAIVPPTSPTVVPATGIAGSQPSISPPLQEKGAGDVQEASAAMPPATPPTVPPENPPSVNKEVLDFNFPCGAYPLKTPLEDQFELHNNGTQRLKYKIERIPSADFQVIFSSNVGFIEPKSYKVVKVKLTLYIETSETLNFFIKVGETSLKMAVILRSIPGVFGVPLADMPLVEDQGYRVPKILATLRLMLTTNQGEMTVRTVAPV
eukprot:TRINITY_DN0_c0_g1_i1.p1 TRINITY_DN0_c0_g1~~TRINITY_DN0_c0_g1_i1.p1  ORF type:complete len:807 (-),score=135.50 TRINITY_DN0_c0_g1_i1:689-3109(-)